MGLPDLASTVRLWLPNGSGSERLAGMDANLAWSARRVRLGHRWARDELEVRAGLQINACFRSLAVQNVRLLAERNPCLLAERNRRSLAERKLTPDFIPTYATRHPRASRCSSVPTDRSLQATSPGQALVSVARQARRGALIARATCGLLVVCLCAAVPVTRVHADPRGAARASVSDYEELIRTALVEMNAGNFAEARALFLKAHDIQPSARTLRGLGYVEFELRRYTVSVRYLRAALLEKKRALEPALRKEVERMLQRALTYTGHFRLLLSPRDAALTVDGAKPELEDDGSLWLEVGSHQLRLSAPRYQPLSQTLNVSGGERSELTLNLVPVASSSLQARAPAATSLLAAPAEPVRSDAAPSEQGVFGKWWFWTAAGVLVAGAAIGVGIAANSGTQTESPLPGNLGEVEQALTRAR